jgi:hypothetical protein
VPCQRNGARMAQLLSIATASPLRCCISIFAPLGSVKVPIRRGRDKTDREFLKSLCDEQAILMRQSLRRGVESQ